MKRLCYSNNQTHQAKYMNTVSETLFKITTLTCSKPDKNYLSELFVNTDDSFTDDEISDSFFKLAWRRIIVFESLNENLIIHRLYQYQSDSFVSSTFPAGLSSQQTIKQIATQAVDTCTLLLIKVSAKNNTYYILAHVYVSDTDTMFACIMTELENFKPESIDIFISYTDNENSSMKQNINRHIDKLKTFMPSVAPEKYDEHILLFRRGSNSDENAAYLSHMEFGICIENSGLTYFGDVTRHPSNKEYITTANLNNWTCVLFETTSFKDLYVLKVLEK